MGVGGGGGGQVVWQRCALSSTPKGAAMHHPLTSALHHTTPPPRPTTVRRLSKRQRNLYEEYMASGNTRATLASGNFLGIMNCLMQLRKVGGRAGAPEGRRRVVRGLRRRRVRCPSPDPTLLHLPSRPPGVQPPRPV